MTHPLMRRWEHLLPPALAARPRDARGFPITYVTALTEDGEPDFTVTHGDLALECARERRCGLCGEPLTYWVAFLGGPRAAVARTYTDPPMHPECAEVAVRICPHIAYRRMPRIEGQLEASVPDGFVTDKPQEWVLGLTRGYSIVRDRRSGHVLFQADPFKFVRRFTYGEDGLIEERATEDGR